MDKELCSFPVWEGRNLSWLSISEKAVVLFESSFNLCVVSCHYKLFSFIGTSVIVGEMPTWLNRSYKLPLITGRTKRDIVDILGIDLGYCISRNEKTGSLGKGREDKSTSETPQRDRGMFSVWNPWDECRVNLVSMWKSQPPQHCRVGPGQGWELQLDTGLSISPSSVLWDHSTVGWIMLLSLALSTFKDHGSLHWALDLGWSPPTISCSWMCFLCAWFQC